MRIEEKGGSFVIVDFDEADAYKIACKIEKDGMDFYKDLRDRSGDEKIKEAMEFLLKEERGHLKLFEELLSEIEREREDTSEEDDLLDSLDYGVFQPYKNIEGLEAAVNEPKKALKLGIIIEEKSIKFYEACKGRLTSSKAIQKVTDIIREERGHKQKLEALYGRD